MLFFIVAAPNYNPTNSAQEVRDLLLEKEAVKYFEV